MKKFTTYLVAAFLLSNALTARAGLTVSLVSAIQNSAKGRTLVFSGTLTNTGTTDQLFLNDIQFALTGSAANYLVPDTNSFFANVPGILLPGENYTGELFRVALSGSASADDYTGTVSVL